MKPAPIVDDDNAIPCKLVQAQHNQCHPMSHHHEGQWFSIFNDNLQNLYYWMAQWVKHQTIEVFKTTLGSVF